MTFTTHTDVRCKDMNGSYGFSGLSGVYRSNSDFAAKTHRRDAESTESHTNEPWMHGEACVCVTRYGIRRCGDLPFLLWTPQCTSCVYGEQRNAGKKPGGATLSCAHPHRAVFSHSFWLSHFRSLLHPAADHDQRRSAMLATTPNRQLQRPRRSARRPGSMAHSR